LTLFDGFSEDEDGNRCGFDHENEILNGFAEAIREVVKLEANQDECSIFTVEIDGTDAVKLPIIGSSVELFDMNQQSIAPILMGTLLSKRPEEYSVCLLYRQNNIAFRVSQTNNTFAGFQTLSSAEKRFFVHVSNSDTPWCYL